MKRLLLFLILLALAAHGQILSPILGGSAPAGASITRGNVNSAVNGSNANPVAVNIALTSGQFIYVIVANYYSDVAPGTPTASVCGTNTFTAAGASTVVGTSRITIFQSISNCTGTQTITVTFSANTGSNHVIARAYGGLTADDGKLASTDNGAGVTPWITGTTATTSTANELVLCILGRDTAALLTVPTFSGDTVSPSGTAGNFQTVNDAFPSSVFRIFDAIVSSTGTYSCSTTPSTTASVNAGVVVTAK